MHKVKLNTIYIYIKKTLLYPNIRNKNVKNLAYNERCYQKLEKKYKKIVNNFCGTKPTIKCSDKVWFCWLQGIENAPILVKKCYESIKNNMSDKEVILLTSENISNYVSFPDYIVKKRDLGYIENAHFSDLLRLELLCKYGGLWIDSTVLVTEKIDKSFFENDLFVFKNVSLYQREELCIRMSNWLIYSKNNNNNILCLTKALIYEYWKKHNYALNYYFFHLFFTIASKKFEDEWNNIPTYSNIPPHLLQFELEKKFSKARWKEITNNSKIHKLNHRIISNDNNSFYSYIIKN